MKERLKVETINGFTINSYQSESLTEKEHQSDIQNWIKKNLIKSINYKHSSYGIKHACERSLGFYVSNYDIKYNMTVLGIKGKSINSKSINYYYPISECVFKK